MSLIRVLRTAAATITKQMFADEALIDSSNVVIVSLTRLDGTVVASGNATDAPGVGTYTYTIPGGPAAPSSATWQLDHLDMTWTGLIAGALVTFPPDRVEVVGGFLFGLLEGRESDPSLASDGTYPGKTLAAKRLTVEVECERICRQAFVPRFARETLSGRGTERIGTKRNTMLRKLRSVSVSGVAWSPTDVAAVAVSDSGMLTRPGGAVWPAGVGNIVVEYEHGWDYPPPDLVEGNTLRLKSFLNRSRSGVPDRVQSYTNEAGTFRMTMPDRDKTGIPDVDAVYEGYTRQRRAVFA